MNAKRIWFKALSLVLCAMVLGSGFVASAEEASAPATTGYSISNPYENIDWDTINQYKTALHTHTNASDGDDTLAESIERHYETGFDVVSTTDHSVVNYSWTDTSKGSNLVTAVMELIGKTDGELVYLQETGGSFSNGVGYEVVTRNGDDYLITEDGREIMRIPYGVEHNAVSVNAHVNAWFADYNRVAPSDYDDAVRNVDKHGGVSVMNHLGEYTQARYELFQEDAYDMDNLTYRYYINKFYGYIDKYDTCIGLDINSKGDGRTRYDRKLWDIMLSKAAEEGTTVTAIASSDAHQLDKIDTGSTVVLAKEKTTPAIKNALLNGEILAQSTCIANRDELAQIAEGLKAHYGETDLYKEIADIVVAYDAEREEIIAENDDGQVGAQWKSIDDEGYIKTATRPVINSIEVNDEEDTITIDSDNALIVRWISDGKVIATTKADDKAFDLNDYADQIEGYVRAEVFGEGGIIYTQGFTLNAELADGDGTDFVFDLGFLDFIFALLDRYTGLLGRIIGNIF
ncbi:MAG: hypothetical protein IJZ57_03500 [Clostridia bacterium]|nr:hypothetical protein [Clostridia bacterium]